MQLNYVAADVTKILSVLEVVVGVCLWSTRSRSFKLNKPFSWTVDFGQFTRIKLVGTLTSAH